jgi:large subunit ribosomal protein L30
MAKLKIKQIKSGISQKPAARGTLRALGLKRIGDEVVQEDVPTVRGQVRAVSHLVAVEEVK